MMLLLLVLLSLDDGEHCVCSGGTIVRVALVLERIVTENAPTLILRIGPSLTGTSVLRERQRSIIVSLSLSLSARAMLQRVSSTLNTFY